MAAATDFLENKILDHIMGVAAYSAPATLYIALFSTATADDGTGTELTGNGYARNPITFGVAASGGEISNSADVEFDEATADWVEVTHAAIFDAATDGNMLFHGPLEVARTVLSGDVIRFKTDTITITID